MEGQLHLFDLPEPTGLAVVSAAKRRRQHAELLLAQGYHPATGLKVNNEHTCGECVHLIRNPGSRFKCAMGQFAAGKLTDILVRWPSCAWWRAAPPPKKKELREKVKPVGPFRPRVVKDVVTDVL